MPWHIAGTQEILVELGCTASYPWFTFCHIFIHSLTKWAHIQCKNAPFHKHGRGLFKYNLFCITLSKTGFHCTSFNNKKIYWVLHLCLGFPGSSASKEFTWNARDPSLIPGLGRSPGEGIGYSLQYSWASLVGQVVKNPPTMQETWIRPLGWEDTLEKGMATHSSILAWRTAWTDEPGKLQSMGSQRVGHNWATSTFTYVPGMMLGTEATVIYKTDEVFTLILKEADIKVI